jgi:hypothetical protein
MRRQDRRVHATPLHALEAIAQRMDVGYGLYLVSHDRPHSHRLEHLFDDLNPCGSKIRSTSDIARTAPIARPAERTGFPASRR